MQINFYGFGATRALSGYCIEVADKSRVSEIRQALILSINNQERYIGLDEILVATAFASDEYIYGDEEIITESITINLLPPVCGG